MRRSLSLFGKVIYTVAVLFAVSVALLFLGTRFEFLGYQVKVVQSGSMEPAIKTGGIVIIAPSATYKVGDVVTYGEDTSRKIPVTHRIVEQQVTSEGTRFLTRGDANAVVDPNPIAPKEIIGKVVVSMPYVGFVIDFVRTPMGYGLLVGIPALIIILDEFADIVWEVRKYRVRKRRTEIQKRKQAMAALVRKKVQRELQKERRVVQQAHQYVGRTSVVPNGETRSRPRLEPASEQRQVRAERREYTSEHRQEQEYKSEHMPARTTRRPVRQQDFELDLRAFRYRRTS